MFLSKWQGRGTWHSELCKAGILLDLFSVFSLLRKTNRLPVEWRYYFTTSATAVYCVDIHNIKEGGFIPFFSDMTVQNLK